MRPSASGEVSFWQFGRYRKTSDALARTFAQAVAPQAKEEERDEDDEFAGQGGHGGFNGTGAWMR